MWGHLATRSHLRYPPHPMPLIEVVQRGDADFSMILVYDVSRWGRFQDADDSLLRFTGTASRGMLSSPCGAGVALQFRWTSSLRQVGGLS